MSTEGTQNIEEAASGWLVLRDSGRWTEADQQRFECWLNADTHNRITYLRLELAWEEAARLRALGAGIPGDLPPPPGRWNLTPFFRPRPHEAVTHRPEAPRPRAWRLAIAASLVLAVVAGTVTYQLGRSGGDRYSTPIGGIASVPMRDGSKITMNTNSQLSVALTADERRIDLKQGEAFFEVAKDPGRPFVVAVGSRRVIAVGTEFAVRRDGEAVEVIVTEGKVRMEDGSANDAVFLSPGAIALADESGLLVERKTLEEAETQLSWRSGVLMFRELPLAEAVAQFNRFNVRKIVIADPALATLRVEGNFRPTNVEAFVRLLESGFPMRASVEDDRIILHSR